MFDLNLLALTLLLHLARPSEHNRQQILCYNAAEGKQSGIKELVEYFEQQEEMARFDSFRFAQSVHHE